MLYAKDQYGNKHVLNSTFRMVGLPFQQKHETLELPGSDGELQTSEPVMTAVTRTISGTLYGTDIDDVKEQRNKLAKFVSKGKIRIGYENENENWYIEGYVVSFDHKYEAGRVLAEVRITVKCDNPFMFGEEVTKEYLVSANARRAELENPPAWLNFQPGTFDVDTGVRLAGDLGYQNNFKKDGNGDLYTTIVGQGFSVDIIGGLSLIAWGDTTYRKFKVFIDGKLEDEVLYTDTSPRFNIRYEKTFEDAQLHTVTFIHTYGGALIVDEIYVPGSCQQTLPNNGVDTYPYIEVESVDTVARFSPLGKVAGDVSHPVSIYGVANSNLLNVDPTTYDSYEENYTSLYFLDENRAGGQNTTDGKYFGFIIAYNLLADQSPYKGLSPIELQNNIQSITSSMWAYGGIFDVTTNASINLDVETRIWTDGDHWSSGVVGHSYSSTSELLWNLGLSDSLDRFIDNYGKIYFLIKSNYASDGTNPSRVILDYFDLETTLNYSKLGEDFLVNSANNLIPSFTSNEWYLSSEAKILDDYSILYEENDNKTGSVSLVQISVKSKTKYSFNGGLGNGTYRIYTINTNEERTLISGYFTGIIVFTTPSDCKAIEIRAQRYFETTDEFIYKKPILTQTSEPQHFQPQEKYTCGFSDEVILTKNDRLVLDPKSRNVEKNGVSLYPLINEDFKFNPMALNDFNHIQFNNTGNVKYKIKYRPKWK